MKIFNSTSIRKKLAILVTLAILPALATLLNAGMEQRRESIKQAKRNILVLTHSMAQVQQDITRSFRQLLSTLSLLPEIQAMDPAASQKILSAMLANNPDYNNLVLVKLNGDVIAAGRGFNASNLADRKHVHDALANNDFAVGEFITARVGPQSKVFAFAYPVRNPLGQPKGVLTGTVNLNLFSRFHSLATLPENSFISLTDNKGIRLLYYPPQETNPVGQPIKPKAWKIASSATGPGHFMIKTSDGRRKLLAFEQVRLQPGSKPYIYVWAGIPESYILKDANAALARNLLLMLLAILIAYTISWVIARKTIISPINELVGLTRKFAKGQFDARSDLGNQHSEFGILTRAFHDMAKTLKKNQTVLLEESERLAVTLRSIGDGVITTDIDGRIILLNPVAEKITGWTQEEARHQPLSQVFTAHSWENHLDQKTSTKEILTSPGTKGLSGQAILHDRQHHQKIIINSTAAIKDTNGDKVGMVLVFRDITEQLRTEQELAKIQKLESIGVLAGGIAHDFNNILAAILGSLDLSLRDKNLSEKTRRLLNQSMNASYRARDLTQQLLTFAKGGEPLKRSTSLAEIVIDSADFVLRGDKVACHYFFPDDLQRVNIDKGQISQVIQNMIINAGQAMPSGGTIEVIASNASKTEIERLALSANDRFVKLTIRDTGIGIPADLLEKIFDPYFSTKQKGSGLGLAISHSIISKHGGAITVDSTPEEGSSFHIYLPATSENSGSPEIQKAEFPSSRKIRIMVLDDEEIVRAIATEMLSEMGHTVVTASEGQQAIDIYQKNLEQNTPLDLMIMDLTIPGGMGGQEALQKILNMNPQAKAVVSSGYSNDPVMANYADYGFVGAIAKPYRFDDMERTINRLLT